MRACAIAQPEPGRGERVNTGRGQNEYYICWRRLSEYNSLTISAACELLAYVAIRNVVAGRECSGHHKKGNTGTGNMH